MVEAATETLNFPKEEEKILEFWKEIDVFQECLKQSKGKPRYSFYDGPPFATGLPHYGHILAGAIKDVVTRYAHQTGHHVERRFGWDTHGLPVEFEIDKLLGIKGPQDVAKMGIDKYNAECRKIVMRYASDWEKIVTRLGRWIDFKNDYKTLYPWFMESVWWVFSELWNKGMVYRGVKVMPYSTACSTPLSNFESGQNYKEVVDPAVMVSFPLESDPSASLVAWTTTPWTLPSNLALCVNPNLIYAKVKDLNNKIYILMEARLEVLFKKKEDYTVLDTFPGQKLKGQRYKPLFPYFAQTQKTAFVILTDDYVSAESGTGIVHQAPYFGEDDYRVCLTAGVITRDQDIVCPVDESGRFVSPVKDFEGQYVKDADKNIIKFLKEAGKLVNASSVKHSYPFCWRSETPLIYKAVPSWFVRVQQMSQDLLACNKATYWVPNFVKEKRFGNWLKDARDWAISRNRYWGTPIPLWVSEDGKEIVCISSIEQLHKLTGVLVTDLHREVVDKLTIPSARPGHPPLRRINEVFDCWFESGSMPYAQQHYPFENRKEFHDRFPADFIAEGIDQTRGWFYTLLVISTALFNKPPFKNLIANGLVLASDGQKMSKRKKNYPDPLEVVNKFGADALRLYLINSPVVRAENLRFKEEGVKEILKDLFLPWYNAYRFFIQNIQDASGTMYKPNKDFYNACSENKMDRWITSWTQSLIAFVRQEMAAYRLYTVVPRLVKFIDVLTNWYVRLNRQRFKGECGSTDKQESLDTLYHVLMTMVCLMAPYTPFICELMYQNLKKIENLKERSVHFHMVPNVKEHLIDKNIEQSVSIMQNIIEMGRVMRDRRTIPIKYPLPELMIVADDPKIIDNINEFRSYIEKELNVRAINLTKNKSRYVKLRAEPDHKTLGSRLKSDFKRVTAAIRELTDEQLQSWQNEVSNMSTDNNDDQQKPPLKVLEYELEASEFRILYNFTGPEAEIMAKTYEAQIDNDILVLLNVTPDQSMLDEGTAREIINRVQKLRKKAHLVPTDRINVYYNISPEGELARVAKEFNEFITTALKVPFIDGVAVGNNIIEETQTLKGSNLKIILTKENSTEEVPACKFINVQLHGINARYGASNSTTVMIENPVGKNVLNVDSLTYEVQKVFGLFGIEIVLKLSDGKILNNDLLNNLPNVSIIAQKKSSSQNVEVQNISTLPIIKTVNVKYGSETGTILMFGPDEEADLQLSKSKVSSIFNLNTGNMKLVKENGFIIVTLN
ncbi:isoleucine--tRNA ligase, cytoplasmic [Adelges cooleyi]|uniref:isoleucine--tRNA ligase, cytoplasmic n=1 Tax=Adelges cooleyi TaxID=133065 RepID=UPI0021800D34|nr:isoleucine--tRNA ligase, cytoplasmic [Adelges cooleyi]